MYKSVNQISDKKLGMLKKEAEFMLSNPKTVCDDLDDVSILTAILLSKRYGIRQRDIEQLLYEGIPYVISEGHCEEEDILEDILEAHLNELKTLQRDIDAIFLNPDDESFDYDSEDDKYLSRFGMVRLGGRPISGGLVKLTKELEEIIKRNQEDGFGRSQYYRCFINTVSNFISDYGYDEDEVWNFVEKHYNIDLHKNPIKYKED